MYQTIIEPQCAEITVEKSKFIAYARPIDDAQTAKRFIESIKRKHWQANHHVPVYLIGQQYEVQRYSDDGEPSGTAGLPVLDMLKKSNTTNLCLVVVRYFGGIKLGKGGLVRAYTNAAKAVLENHLVTFDTYRKFSCTCDYSDHGKLNYLLEQNKAIVIDTNYSDTVKITLYIIEADAPRLEQTIIDTLANRVVITSRQLYGALVNKQFIEKP